jgi:glycosyltransferase involved in cell wall biosynthesis
VIVRVLIACPDFLLTREGGLRTQVLRTIEELQAQGCGVTLFNSWDVYRRSDFDLAHCFSMDSQVYFKAKAIAAYGMPIVFSSVMWRVGSLRVIRLAVELLRRFPKRLFNDVVCCREMSGWAQRILPNTAAEAEWLHRAIGVDQSKCGVVPNGVDDLIEDESAALPDDWPQGDFVLCVAAIIRRKNLTLLARTAIECGYPVVLVGPHAEASVVAELRAIQRSHPGMLHLPGPLAQTDPRLAAAYRRCRVFCLPSNYETPGIAALEAALKGARIVITEVGGTREYFGDDAVYLKPQSERSLRNALTTGWQLGRPRDGDRIRQRLLSEFSWQAVADKTLQQYACTLNAGA